MNKYVVCPVRFISGWVVMLNNTLATWVCFFLFIQNEVRTGKGNGCGSIDVSLTKHKHKRKQL